MLPCTGPNNKYFALREKGSNLNFFWSVFSFIRNEYGLSTNMGKYRSEKIRYSDIFHTVLKAGIYGQF